VLAVYYVGFMVTSPIMGILADTSSLSVAFLTVVGVSGLGIWRLAGKVP